MGNNLAKSPKKAKKDSNSNSNYRSVTPMPYSNYGGNVNN